MKESEKLKENFEKNECGSFLSSAGQTTLCRKSKNSNKEISRKVPGRTFLFTLLCRSCGETKISYKIIQKVIVLFKLSDKKILEKLVQH